LARLVDEGIEDLMLLNWQETGEGLPFDPDWERALELEFHGVLHCLALRDEGRLAGYSGFYVTPHFHSRRLLNAVNDVVFTAPWARGAGVRLVRGAEPKLVELGAKRIVYHVRTGTTAGDLLAKLGYVHFESGYSKQMG